MSESESIEKRRSWQQDPEGVKENILAVATKVFAENGLDGARIDEIAALTKTSKRMIYYYFGDKNGLYGQVLEAAYARMLAFESREEVLTLPPAEGLERLITFLFDHHRQHPEFIRLLMVENIHNGTFLGGSEALRQIRPSSNSALELIYQRGVAEGVFRPGLDTRKLRLMFAGVSFFNVSNRASFSLAHGDDLWAEDEQVTLRSALVESILRYAMTPSAAAHHFQDKSAGESHTMMDAELRPFLDVWGSKWASLPAKATPQDRRKRFEVVAAEMRLPTPPEVDTSAEHWVETTVAPVRVRVFRYQSEQLQPVMIYMHGGAYMQGSPETHWDITSRIAAWNRQTVISVDYALAPDHPFPVAINQVDGVVGWVVESAAMLGIDPERISIGGDSAGGNLAAAAALKWRGQSPKLKAQLLIYPQCDFDLSRPSFAENANGPMITLAGMDAVNSGYCPNPADLNHPFAAPLLAENHEGLPPAYIAVAQFDPLRDSGLAYAEVLKAAGVPTEIDQGPGLIHGYLRAMEYCASSRDSLKRMCAWLAKQNEAVR